MRQSQRHKLPSRAFRKRPATGACIALALWLPLAGMAAELPKLFADSQSWLVAQAAVQKKVDALDDERGSLLAEYQNVLRETDGLKIYNQQLRAQIASQQAEMDSVRREGFEVERTNREILPLMQKMLDTLESFVDLDVPFLPEERQGRIRKLREMMDRADVTTSEKYRRIVESYQVEMEYGRTLEGYEGKLGDKVVSFLRVGRVGLLYQTPDKVETGYWDAVKKAFVRDDRYRDDVHEGLKIARKQVSPNLIIAPVLAAKGGN